MKTDIARPQSVTRPVAVRRPARRPPAPRRNTRLALALTLTIAAGFLLGLGLPVHP